MLPTVKLVEGNATEPLLVATKDLKSDAEVFQTPEVEMVV